MSDPVFVTGYGQFYYLCDRDPTVSEPFCYVNIPDFKYMWFNTVSKNAFLCLDNTSDAMSWQRIASSLNMSSILSGIGITSPSPTFSGTTNQVNVGFASNNYTFSTPQNIGNGSSPSFSGMNLSGLTASNFVTTDASKNLISQTISQVKTTLGIVSATPRSPVLRSSPAFSTAYRPSVTNDVQVNLCLNFTALLSLNSLVNIQISPDNVTWMTLFPIVRTLALAINFNDAFTFTVPVGSYYRIVQQTGTSSSIVSIYELTV